MLTTRSLLAATLLGTLLLAGCTTYTFNDGHRETVWGVPTEDETLSRQERENAPPRYREPGEIPEAR